MASYRAIKNGIIKQIMEGITTYSIRPNAVTFCNPQHGSGDVTMGDHAPPAFAAITTKAAYHNRSSFYESIFVIR